MTLIAGLGNYRQVILISDRRLSWKGKPVDEESNKATTFVCRDARLVAAFTGVARAGNFITRRWLLEALVESATPEYLLEPTLNRFRDRASRDIKKAADDYDRIYAKNGQPKLDRRLSILLGGYSYVEEPPRCYFFLISNFEKFNSQYSTAATASDEFTLDILRESRPSEIPFVMVAYVGNTDAMKQRHVEPLQTLLREDRPPEALVGKGIEIIRQVSKLPKSGQVIGEQCTSIVLPRDPSLPTRSQYHSAKNATRVFTPSHVEARGGEFGAYVLDSPYTEIRDAADQPFILAVAKVGRNHPCPCGNGKKYKKCHGAPNDGKWSFQFGS